MIEGVNNMLVKYSLIHSFYHSIIDLNPYFYLKKSDYGSYPS